MKLRLKDYDKSLKDFKRLLTDKKLERYDDFIIDYAACMGVPLIVLYRFVYDMGINQEYCALRVAELCKFYDVELILD